MFITIIYAYEIITLLANLYNSAAGSVPTDKMNISGVVGEESLYISAKSDDCGSM